MQNQDIELIKSARNGDENSLEYIILKYKSLASKIARRYFLVGHDEDDLEQEALIGLFKAYQSFDYKTTSDFKTFATLCITRQILSAIKIANRKKNKALNDYVSLNNQGGVDSKIIDDSDELLFYIIPSNDQLPDDKLISKEDLNEIKIGILSKLSKYEKRVLCLYLKGYKYKEIALKLGTNSKSVENSISRIKTKLSYLKKL